MWNDGDLVLTRVWLCRWDGEGRKAWDRLGRLGEVPRDPWHPSTEVPRIQMLSNRESGLLQDGCGGSYRILCFLQDSPVGLLQDVFELDF